jgi:acetoin utilization deacetylase AcuC-like enzyme
MGDWHPESPARLHAIQDALVSAGLDFAVRQIDAPLATREQLERVHDPAYLDLVEATAPSEGHALLDHETRMNPHSHEAALRAAGAVVAAVDLVMAGEVEVAFCSVRPPGHHAERARSMGFCIYNNVAVGAAHALAAHGLERVAIIDFDVHHGNGTEDIFRDEPRVLLCSSFQHPFYPNLGAETELPHILNLPLPAGTGGEAYRKAVENLWPEALDAFRPQLIFFSAGFDAHASPRPITAGSPTWSDGPPMPTPRAASSPPWKAATPCMPWAEASPPTSTPCWVRVGAASTVR